MADLREKEELDREVLAFVRKSEEAALQAARSWAKTVGEFVPVEMPMVHDLVNRAFDFTEETLRIQRELVHNVLHETRSMVERLGEAPAKGTPRAPTHAPHARRSPSRAKTTSASKRTAA